MPISQTTITGSVKTPANTDAQITGVIFKLSGSDYEAGEVIAANSVPATVTTAAGDFTVTLWPNDKGIFGNTRYSVVSTFSDGSTLPGLKDIYVTYSPTSKTIEDVVFETIAAGPVKPNTLKVLTQAQYEATSPKLATTLYLIKG